MARQKKPSAYSLALEQVQSGTPEPEEKPTEQPDVQTVKHSNSKPAKQPDVQTAKQLRIKATFYLKRDDIVAIDKMQTKQFQKSGKKPEKSELVSEAIQLLFEQQNS